MTRPLFELLREAYDREALGHAMLLVVPAGETPDDALEAEFRKFRALLLCPERQRGAGPCGRCPSCRLALSTEPTTIHPDLVRLHPGDNASYTVDDARSLLAHFALTRSLAKNRVAWIDQADALSSGGQSGAANALLKILEEPRPASFLVLVSARPEALLATIRSRCQIFRLPRKTDGGPPKALPEGWEALERWMRAGLPIGQGPPLPADDDAFWKDREAALTELEGVFEGLWTALKGSWAGWGREEGLRAVKLFQRLEECLGTVRGYGNAPLQWLSFRMDAKLDP